MVELSQLDCFSRLLYASLLTFVRNIYQFLLLPFAVATTHLSFGLGFLISIFKFWNRWKDRLGMVPILNCKP